MKIFKKLIAGAMTAALTLSTYMPVLASQLFDDIEPGDNYYAGIKYCKEHGIMTGYNDRVFGTTDPLTRGEMITVIYRMLGKPAATGSGFTDVPYDSFYKQASTWAVQSGIMTGNLHPDGSWTFDGQNPVTYEQACLVMHRYAQTFGGGAVDGSRELPEWISQTPPWAYNAVKWATTNHYAFYINGSNYMFNQWAQRGWIASLIQRYLDMDYDAYSSGSSNSQPGDPNDISNEEYANLFAEVLRQYTHAANEGYFSEELRYKYPYVNFEQPITWSRNASIGYTLADLAGNDTPFLVMFEITDNRQLPLDIFAVQNRQVVNIFTGQAQTSNFRSRDGLRILSDFTLEHHASGGANTYKKEWYRVFPGNVLATMTDAVDLNDFNDQYSYIRYLNNGQWVDTTRSFTNQIEAKYPQNDYVFTDIRPLTSFHIS